MIFGYAISLASFIAADFLWRKIFWNKKKNIDATLIENLSTIPKMVFLRITVFVTKWTGRFLASISIPLLMFFIECSIYEVHCKENQLFFEPQFHLAGASLAILGCIIGWRFPLIGAVMLLAGNISFCIREGKISSEGLFLPFYLATAAYFATWALMKFSERILKKNAG